MGSSWVGSAWVVGGRGRHRPRSFPCGGAGLKGVCLRTGRARLGLSPGQDGQQILFTETAGDSGCAERGVDIGGRPRAGCGRSGPGPLWRHAPTIPNRLSIRDQYVDTPPIRRNVASSAPITDAKVLSLSGITTRNRDQASQATNNTVAEPPRAGRPHNRTATTNPAPVPTADRSGDAQPATAPWRRRRRAV